MIGIVLLSSNGCYVGTQGELPARPWFDKDLLLAICTGANILCSHNTEKDLPKSVREVANTINAQTDLKGVNLGIATFKANPPDLMLIVISSTRLDGKDFDIEWLTDNYKCISKNAHYLDAVSVWLKNPCPQLELDLGV